MRREAVEVIEKDGFKAGIYQDEDPQSPKDWGTFGTLVTWHREYAFQEDGRKAFGEPADFLEIARREGYIFLPVSMIDHSGISLYEGRGAHPHDPGGWDSGQVGFIYTTAEKMKAGLGRVRKSERIARTEEILRSELKAWDQYVTGDVYGVVVEGPDGEDLDSCWGFYGSEYAEQEARRMLEDAIENERSEKVKIGRVMAL